MESSLPPRSVLANSVDIIAQVARGNQEAFGICRGYNFSEIKTARLVIAIMRMAKRRYHFKFIHRSNLGSPEQFFHYLWGYMFPALNEILSITHDECEDFNQFLFTFRSCGPIMDRLTHELLSVYPYEYRIIDKSDVDSSDFTTIDVPKWDFWLLGFKSQLWSIFLDFRLNPKMEHLKIIPRLFRPDIYMPPLLESTFRVKNSIMQKMAAQTTDPFSKDGDGVYLILKRSPEPEYYKEGGGAEIPTYGTGRRMLSGIEEAAQILRNQEIPVEVYEPGANSLKDQIRKFSTCKGIIGIRGAEFANMIWMKKNSKVILLYPSYMRNAALERAFGKIFELEYHEIPLNDSSKSPRFNPESIIRYLI